jgi:hypothetical protein
MISRHGIFFYSFFCREALQNVGENNFVIEKTLPISIYYYCFIVDGHWTYALEFPSNIDNSRLWYNILDLQVVSWFTFTYDVYYFH